MAVLSKEDLLNKVKVIIGENSDDDTLAFVEDITDTLTDMEKRASGDGEDWKAKYEQNDKEWRNKYKERFFNTSSEDADNNETHEEEEDTSSEVTFDDLFTESEA